MNGEKGADAGLQERAAPLGLWPRIRRSPGWDSHFGSYIWMKCKEEETKSLQDNLF